MWVVELFSVYKSCWNLFLLLAYYIPSVINLSSILGNLSNVGSRVVYECLNNWYIVKYVKCG